MPRPATVHPTAILRGEIELAEGVEIGPYCTLTGGPGGRGGPAGGEGGDGGEPGAGPVRLGPGVRLIASCHLLGPVTIGAGTVVHPGVCLGFRGQDLKFAPGAPTAGVVIGEKCQLREHVTVHAATKEAAPTRVGDRAFMMVGSHVGHDVTVGNDVTMVNGAIIGGHAQVADRVILSGLSAIHQFARVGRLAMIAGLSGISLDVPPFCIADGANALAGVNVVGLRRAGFVRDDIDAIREAYRRVLRHRMPRAEAVAMLQEIAARSPIVGEVAQFVAASSRGVCSGSPTRRIGSAPAEAGARATTRASTGASTGVIR